MSLGPLYILLGEVFVQVLCPFFNWTVCLPGVESCDFFIYFGDQTSVWGIIAKYIFPRKEVFESIIWSYNLDLFISPHLDCYTALSNDLQILIAHSNINFYSHYILIVGHFWLSSIYSLLLSPSERTSPKCSYNMQKENKDGRTSTWWVLKLLLLSGPPFSCFYHCFFPSFLTVLC